MWPCEQQNEIRNAHTAAHSNSSGTRTRLNVTLTHSAENRLSSPPNTNTHIQAHYELCCREAATKTCLTLRYPLSEAYLLFVYVTLLFVVFAAAESLRPSFQRGFQTSRHTIPLPCLSSRSPYPFFLYERKLPGRDR